MTDKMRLHIALRIFPKMIEVLDSGNWVRHYLKEIIALTDRDGTAFIDGKYEGTTSFPKYLYLNIEDLNGFYNRSIIRIPS